MAKKTTKTPYNNLIKELTKREGKKVQVSRGNMMEVLRCLAEILWLGDKDPEAKVAANEFVNYLSAYSETYSKNAFKVRVDLNYYCISKEKYDQMKKSIDPVIEKTQKNFAKFGKTNKTSKTKNTTKTTQSIN